MNKTILVTGGAGFIGSNLIHYLIRETDYRVINVDKLTYSGNRESLSDVEANDRYIFEQTDICNAAAVENLFKTHHPDLVMHLAAESHVDRSIDGPADFLNTNIIGTFNLLEAARSYWQTLDMAAQSAFRFLHISTDEVFGSLGKDGFFKESTRYQPNSPYSASKASSDHLVRAWFHTYGLPTLITNCSNNYGPFQFPEKLIPVVILKALKGEPIPVYGKGENIRDWLFVEDHVRALLTVLEKGAVGETYNVGGNTEQTNLELVKKICSLLDEWKPNASIGSHEKLITFVADRPGHDLRYAIDASKIKNELGWQPEMTLESGLKKTVQWYLDHEDWWQRILSGAYRLERIGLRNRSQEPG